MSHDLNSNSYKQFIHLSTQVVKPRDYLCPNTTEKHYTRKQHWSFEAYNTSKQIKFFIKVTYWSNLSITKFFDTSGVGSFCWVSYKWLKLKVTFSGSDRQAVTRQQV